MPRTISLCIHAEASSASHPAAIGLIPVFQRRTGASDERRMPVGPRAPALRPSHAARRGSQVSFEHPQGYAVMQALIARGVIGDYREPRIMRFGFTPLYTRFVDVWDAVEVLRDLLDTGAWDKPEFHQRGAVT